MRFKIADSRSDPNALEALFERNLTAQYISHSELQGMRAVDPNRWADNIGIVLTNEIKARLGQPLDCFPSETSWQGIVECHEEDGTLIGLAFVSFFQEAVVPYSIIEDVVIDKLYRGAGRGEQFMRWLIKNMHDAGAKRIFLESGLSNHHAHHLFERLGFETVSIVMMRECE